MKRIAIDSNVVDVLADTAGLLDLSKRAHGAGELVFVVSHVIHDELAATPDQTRRAHLLAAYEALPKRIVATHGAAWNVSRWGEAAWGDGSESGVSIGQIVTPSRGRVHDALIAITASGDADVLVTDDPRLAKAARRAGVRCDVWGSGDLVRLLEQTGGR